MQRLIHVAAGGLAALLLFGCSKPVVTHQATATATATGGEAAPPALSVMLQATASSSEAVPASLNHALVVYCSRQALRYELRLILETGVGYTFRQVGSNPIQVTRFQAPGAAYTALKQLWGNADFFHLPPEPRAPDTVIDRPMLALGAADAARSHTAFSYASPSASYAQLHDACLALQGDKLQPLAFTTAMNQLQHIATQLPAADARSELLSAVVQRLKAQSAGR